MEEAYLSGSGKFPAANYAQERNVVQARGWWELLKQWLRRRFKVPETMRDPATPAVRRRGLRAIEEQLTLRCKITALTPPEDEL